MEPLCKHAAKRFITGVQLKEFHECAMLMIQEKKHIQSPSNQAYVILSNVQMYHAHGFSNTQARMSLSLTSTYLNRPPSSYFSGIIQAVQWK